MSGLLHMCMGSVLFWGGGGPGARSQQKWVGLCSLNWNVYFQGHSQCLAPTAGTFFVQYVSIGSIFFPMVGHDIPAPRGTEGAGVRLAARRTHRDATHV